MRFLFMPFSFMLGLVAGGVAKRIFGAIWGLVDDKEPPEAEHRDTNWPQLIVAAVLQGAIFRVTKQATDRGLRLAFLGATGSWPGEEERKEK